MILKVVTEILGRIQSDVFCSDLFFQGYHLNVFVSASSPIIKGSSEVKGILYYSDTIQDELSKYYGSVTLNTVTNINPNLQTKIKIEGSLAGIGVGSLTNNTLTGSLFGEGTVTISCGIRKILFPNGSISLVLGIT